MLVLLRTACLCERLIDIPNDLPTYCWKVVLFAPFNFYHTGSVIPADCDTLKTRTFEWRGGWLLDQVGKRDIRVYEEVLSG
jgi:hypothetical protein